MRMFQPRFTRPLVMAALALSIVAPAKAQLALTPQGITDGFSLDTVITGIPYTGFCCGPLGSATNSAGQIVVQVYQQNNYVFNDVNNQTFAQALSSASPPVTASSYGMAITNDQGVLYAGNNDAGGVLQKLNSDGSLNMTVATTPSTGVAGHGIWTNPVSHDLVTASGNGLWDINPTTGVATQINTFGGFDGVSVSPDGKTIYGAYGGYIYGYTISTGTEVYQSPYIGSPDGTGVIYGGAFNGDIVANGNDGNVWLLDPTGMLPDGSMYEMIASGGSRGDYVGVDSTNGSLFLSQTDRLDRLVCGAGCGFTPTVPEPSTWSMMVLGFAGLGFAGWRASRKTVVAA